MPGLVYFIKPVGMDGPVKIGTSSSPKTRLCGLAAWSPFPLEIVTTFPGGYPEESFLHSCFAENHSHREWFFSTPLLRETMTAVERDGSLESMRAKLAPTGSIHKKKVRNRSPETLFRMSVRQKIHWASKKLRAIDENGAWGTPDDIEKILIYWSGWHGVQQREPTSAEMARINEYLASPAEHSVIPSWRRPKVAA